MSDICSMERPWYKIKTYFILLKSGTGAMVILFKVTGWMCGLNGSSATISLIYSIYLKQRNPVLPKHKRRKL